MAKKIQQKIAVTAESKDFADMMGERYGLTLTEIASRLIKFAHFAGEDAQKMMLRDYMGDIDRRELEIIAEALLDCSRGSPETKKQSGEATRKSASNAAG